MIEGRRLPPIAVATGISWWKRKAIARLLASDAPAALLFEDEADRALAAAIEAGGAIAYWPSRTPEQLSAAAEAVGVPLIAVEDGFVRSIGLGSGLHPPSSIILDTSGIYYDPRQPSDLETMLETQDFSPELLDRAEVLRKTIIASGISKYESGPPPSRSARGERRTVLVTGQVEDDRSVIAGGGGVQGNQDLLRRARAAEPDAHIIFKPHPDVDAGHRVGRVPDARILAIADQIVRHESMASLFARVDAVHVLTSLAGFEALLRGLKVTTHGQPFYAGWGLTKDLAGPVPRRHRRLTLPQLVAAALILYPRYLDPVSQQPCSPETLLRRFAEQKGERRSWLIHARRWQGRVAKLFGTTTD